MIAFGATGSDAEAASVGYHETHTQTVDAGNSLNAVSCVPATTTCITVDSNGNALYSTDVSATAAAAWTSWGGPSGQKPAEAVSCPATTLCILADGAVAGGGGNVYRTSSLGGSWLSSFKPANGVGALSCPTTSFCVAALEGGGYIRYSTNPSGIVWTAVEIGIGATKGVSCLSASFCAVVDGTGNTHVAVTENGVKEAAGWKATNIDGTTPLEGIVCTSTSSCMAVDGSGSVLNLTIGPSGEATVSAQDIEGAAELTAITCGGTTCATVDGNGAAFSSTDAGADWSMRFGGGAAFTSVSCASPTLCVAVTVAGDVTAFNPASTVAPLRITTSSLPSGLAGAPYEAELQATGGEPPPYQWSATGLPPGLSIDPTNGRISGTPMTAVCVTSPCPQPPATYTPTVFATDSDGVQASESFAIKLSGTDVNLKVSTTGSGSGTVDSNPTGIGACGSPLGRCSALYEDTTVVTLSAAAAPGSIFDGWSGGGCSGTGACRVTLSGDTEVVANFVLEAAPPPAVTRCLVPRLAGMTLSKARSALRRAHCTLGKLIKPKRGRGRPGGPLVVRRSSPARGTILPVHGKVRISLGPRR